MFASFLQNRVNLVKFTRLSLSKNLSTNALETPKKSTTNAAHKPLTTNRFGKNLIKITACYMLVIVVGITTFYYAKKDVNDNRVENLKFKKEMAMVAASSDVSQKYPNRFELYKNEKN